MSLKNNFSKGDILFGRKHSNARHPIIYLYERDVDFFIGGNDYKIF